MVVRKLIYLVVSTAVAVAVSATAAAQPSVVEGPGYEVGEGTVLHPSIGAETGVSSNVFNEESAAGPVAAPVIRLLGRLALASAQNEPPGEAAPLIAEDGDAPPAGDNPGAAPLLDWRLGARLMLEQYLGASAAVQDQTALGGGLDLRAVAYPASRLSWVVVESFVRATQPTNFESRGQINRDINRLHLGADYKPGSGAFLFSGRYENLFDKFENDANDFASRLQHLLRARAEWQFLPITRFFLDASLGFYGGLGGASDAGLAKVSSMPLRAQVGIATLITELTSVKAHIGYGNGFYASGPSFSNVLAGGEFGYRYSPTGRFSVALDYGFEDSVNANFYRDYALIGRVDQQIGLLLLQGNVGLRFRGYRGVPMALSNDEAREDLLVNLTVRGQYLFRDWLAFTGEFNALADQTAFRYRVDGPIPIDDPSFQRIDLTVGVLAAF